MKLEALFLLNHRLTMRLSMEYKRTHSNGFEVLIQDDPARRDWWQVHVVRSGSEGESSALLGLRTLTLENAKKIGDSVASVSHECNDKCERLESCRMIAGRPILLAVRHSGLRHVVSRANSHDWPWLVLDQLLQEFSEWNPRIQLRAMAFESCESNTLLRLIQLRSHWILLYNWTAKATT